MTGIVAVVGGSGFVGSRLCRRLKAAGRQFRIIDIAPSFDFPELVVRADITNLADLTNSLNGCSAIINLAAQHRDDVRPLSLYEKVNVEGSENICAAADQLRIGKIVFTSTVACYGFAEPGADESAPMNPFNEYGRTKMRAEAVYRAWYERSPESRSLVVVRPTVIFGERNRGNVYNLFKQIESGRFAMIGSGLNRKSMAYVENVAEFIVCSLSAPGMLVSNYVDKPDYSMRELVDSVRESLGRAPGGYLSLPYSVGLCLGYGADIISAVTRRSLPVSAVRVRKFCANTQFNMRQTLDGFQAPVTLREGIERTIAHDFLGDPAAEGLFFSE